MSAARTVERFGRDAERLDLTYVAVCGLNARAAILAGEPAALDYQPGNGTRYAIVLTPCRGLVGDAPHEVARRPDAKFVLSLVNGSQRAHVFELGDEPFPSYLMEKLDVTDGDAIALAALLMEMASD